MTEDEIEVVRRAFARQMLAVAGIDNNPALERAFGEVRRERFLGPHPWMIANAGGGSTPLPANDPVYAYQDILFALSPSRGVNNGSPSLHARLLNALAPEAGQSVVHIGAGTGYYTAILAELVGPNGHVIAIEIDPVLGRMASETLRELPNVEVRIDDGGGWPRNEADHVYVNFAVTAPPAPWIERLSPNGRLVIPLGVPGKPGRPAGPRFSSHGGAFLITRREGGFAASHIGAAFFVHAEGDPAPVDDAAVGRLQNAFRSGSVEFVRSLVWKREAEARRCWFWSPDWSLSYDS